MKAITAENKLINEMDTLSILWALIYRHRVILLITSNVITLTLWLMQQAPIALHNFKG